MVEGVAARERMRISIGRFGWGCIMSARALFVYLCVCVWSVLCDSVSARARERRGEAARVPRHRV